MERETGEHSMVLFLYHCLSCRGNTCYLQTPLKAHVNEKVKSPRHYEVDGNFLNNNLCLTDDVVDCPV